jgi:DNA-binding LytR/AlgR family response regulator
MEKINVIIVEDKTLIAEGLRATLQKNRMEVIGVFDKGEDALQSLEEKIPDLILMDIQLAGAMDGISTAKMISDNYEIPIIYLTDFEDEVTVQRAIKTRPANYLGKPFNEAQLIRAINIAFANFTQTSNTKKSILENYIFIKGENGYEKVALDDIVYLEADGAYCKVITTQQKYTQSTSMNHVLEQLNGTHFIRIHRSYVVNANRITRIDGNQVILGDHKVDMSRSLRDGLIEKLPFLK